MLWLCLIKRNLSGASCFQNKPTDVSLHASTTLKDKTQFGFFASNKFEEENKINFGLGLKKTVNKDLTVKAKFDKNCNVSVFGDAKIGGGIGVQSTIATNFAEDFTKNGFLGNVFALGIKLKYEN